MILDDDWPQLDFSRVSVQLESSRGKSNFKQRFLKLDDGNRVIIDRFDFCGRRLQLWVLSVQRFFPNFRLQGRKRKNQARIGHFQVTLATIIAPVKSEPQRGAQLDLFQPRTAVLTGEIHERSLGTIAEAEHARHARPNELHRS